MPSFVLNNATVPGSKSMSIQANKVSARAIDADNVATNSLTLSPGGTLTGFSGGFGTQIAIGQESVASASNTIALGGADSAANAPAASAASAIAIGCGDDGGARATGIGAIAIGGTEASYGFNVSTTASGNFSTVVGGGGAQCADVYGVCVGAESIVDTGAPGGISIGTFSDCRGQNGVVVGYSNRLASTATNGVIVGYLNYIRGPDCVAIGAQAMRISTVSAQGANNIAIGSNIFTFNSVAAADNIAIGTNALTNLTAGDSNVSIGVNSSAGTTTGTDNVVVGTSATAGTSSGTVAIGRTASAAGGNFSVAIGEQATTTAANQLAINVSGTATESLVTTFATFNSVAPSAGTLAVPNAVGFLRVTIAGTPYDLALFNADST